MSRCIVSAMMVLDPGRNVSYDDCVFDMLNIFLRARSFDPANWKKGYVVKFPIVDGDGRTPAQIKFAGKRNHQGRQWCEVSLFAFGLSWSMRRASTSASSISTLPMMKTMYPVRLDMFLKFGSAKAFLIGMKGTRNPITSRVK